MAVFVSAVEGGSPAFKAGIKTGDTLIKINGNDINDVLDYRFYMTERNLEIEYLSQGKALTAEIRKGEYEELGLEFDTFLMDKQHGCKNKCIFCFVDQLPKGMRDTLYFKDDDSRMSFLFGNYITLTNMTDDDIDRIIKMKISPINISVHTTNPVLRCEMMKNPNSGDSLRFIKKLADAGIKLHTQLVLCPGINDGDELKRTLNDLSTLFPAVESIALVPVGLTKFREGLYPLRMYTKEEAGEVVNTALDFAERFYKKNGTHLVYLADEFFIKAGMQLPESDYYDDFSQLDNGVGLIASLKSDFKYALTECEPSDKKRSVTIATGADAAPFIAQLIDELAKKWHNLNCRVVPIINNYFGSTITVAGLVTATDIINQLSKADLGEELIIPEVMLRYEQDKFLDDITVDELSKRLNVPIKIVKNDGFDLLSAVCGE